MAQSQAKIFLGEFKVPQSSVLGRQIWDGYLNLGAAVAAVYNYECGDLIPNSFSCTNDKIAVVKAQLNLETLMTPIIQNNVTTILVIAILWILFGISILCFMVFLFFGIIETFYKTTHYISDQNLFHNMEQNILPENTLVQNTGPEIAVPASPFD